LQVILYTIYIFVQNNVIIPMSRRLCKFCTRAFDMVVKMLESIWWLYRLRWHHLFIFGPILDVVTSTKLKIGTLLVIW